MMADTASTLQHDRTIFDGWRSISLSLYMTLAGYAVLVGVPVISTAWVNLLGFSEVEVGRVAGADLGGLSLGALVAAVLVATINRRLHTRRNLETGARIQHDAVRVRILAGAGTAYIAAAFDERHLHGIYRMLSHRNSILALDTATPG